ncbi:MAG: DUF5916 domain-containing protein [Bacteroidetes bacterium]|nr:DUF5916 domain-containing protein [Bacteroidota bacterium]
MKLRILVAVALLGLLPAFAVAQNAPVPSIEATYATEKPRADGLLDDAIWKQIQPMTDFVQRWPVEGADPTEESWVKIAYDEDYLYFAFQFSDKEPELIRAKNMERGGRNDRDDHAYIGIDTFLDGRNAFLFEMNALGTQDDALIADERMTLDSYSWDAVFVSETVINDKGWSMEVRIPFRQLRFPEGDDLTFGLWMRRTVNRKNEIQNWPLIPLTYGTGYSDDIRSVSRYGRLTGLKNIRRGKNIEIKPYVISGAQNVRRDLKFEKTESDTNYDAGFDLKYGITSNLTLDLTVNTDFAQVEDDNTQLNLTRFSLFFPEKREFFLERAGIFEHGDSRRTQTFFSRQIGLTEAILAGSRLTGQIGRFNVGLLNIETAPDEGSFTDKMGQIFGDKSANNSVARLQTNFLNRGSAGFIFTNYDRAGSYNRAFGLDVSQRFGSASSADVWFTTVSDSNPDNEDQAASASVNFRNALYGASLSYTSVGENFRPRLGFVQRRDIRQSIATVTYSPIFEKGPFRQMTVHAMGIHTNGQDGELQSWDFDPSVSFSTRERDNIRFSGSRSFDRLETAFNIRSNASIPAGDYTYNRIAARFTSDPSRKFSGTVGIETGQFYHGNRTTMSAMAGYRQSKYLTLGGGLNRSSIDLPIANGNFSATTASLDILASVSRKLFAKALIQYDNFSRNVNANIRVDWIHNPGSDLFLVFNTSYHVADDHETLFDPRAELLMNNVVGVAKLTYLILL